MSGSYSAAFHVKVLKNSSAHTENSCQSCLGAPSSSQMTGTGYGRAMSATTSQRPSAISGSVNCVMMSVIVVSRRATALGVNAFDSSRRSRAWSSPLTLSSDAVTRSHKGPDVMPCASRPRPGGGVIR